MICADKVTFFDDMDRQHLMLTYDDVRLRTRAGQGEPLPDVLDITSRFSEHVELKVPFVSAAMDTVTDGNMAITMAKLGGIGVIHAAMSIEQQRVEVRRVKMAINGLIEKPITVGPDDSLEQINNFRTTRQFNFASFPVVGADGMFLGMLTRDDFKYASNQMVSAGEAMHPESGVISRPIGTDMAEAYLIMKHHKTSQLPLLNDDGTLGGLYLLSDVSRIVENAGQFNIDGNGQLRTAAAVSTGKDTLDRVKALRDYLDVVVIDTADGDSYYAFQTLKAIKEAYPDLDVVVGNISEAESAVELAEQGANGIKVGQGPGSICSTRRETGIGMPQVSAVYLSAKALSESGFEHIPVCADGGVKDHGDPPIAFAALAGSVMMGRALAGTHEAPGAVKTLTDGSRVKVYRGMGSESALRDNDASRQRYGGGAPGPILAEGVEAQIPYEGSVVDVLGLYTQALRKALRYTKHFNLADFRQQTRLARITNAGLRESHPHDVESIVA